jgi:hypothetical protein
MRRFYSLLLLFLFFGTAFGPVLLMRLSAIRSDLEWKGRDTGRPHDGERVYRHAWPVSLAYQADQPDYLPDNAAFELYGIHYRVIRQRYMRDTLYLDFVLDLDRNRLHNSLHLFSTFIQKNTAGILGFPGIMVFHFLPVQQYSPRSPDLRIRTDFCPFWLEPAPLYWGAVPSPPPKA